MAKSTAPTSLSPRNLQGGRGGSLIDWREPARNAHVLDWRERAHEFGLLPVGPVEEGEAIDARVLEPPERLLKEEEPEAFDDQHLDDAEHDALSSEELEEPAETHLPHKELDLVCVYLKHIGRRKLLKARDEQEIGRTIERARGDLLAELGTIPVARQTLLTLAERADRRADVVVVEIDGKAVADTRDLIARTASTAPGIRVIVKVFLDGKEQTRTVTIEEQPVETVEEAPAADSDGDDGLTLGEITPPGLSHRAVASVVRGALVVRVAPDSPADDAELVAATSFRRSTAAVSTRWLKRRASDTRSNRIVHSSCSCREGGPRCSFRCARMSRQRGALRHSFRICSKSTSGAMAQI